LIETVLANFSQVALHLWRNDAVVKIGRAGRCRMSFAALDEQPALARPTRTLFRRAITYRAFPGYLRKRHPRPAGGLVKETRDAQQK
jgi:hypothetical protein